MKTMIEYLTTLMILAIMMFSFTSITLSELEIIIARNRHTEAIEKLQVLSDYQEITVKNYFNNLNSNSDLDGYFNYCIEDKRVLVDYIFDIDLPLIGTIKDNVIEGYAR